MSDTKVAGAVGYHTIVSPDRIEEFGTVHAVNSALEGARNEIRELLRAWKHRPVNIHLVVTIEPLTDSAGSPLMTRDSGG